MFSSLRLGDLSLKNRFMRSPTWEGLAAPSGEITPKLLEKMQAIASGGVALICISHSYVAEEGKAGKGQIGIHCDQMIPSHKEMTKSLHELGVYVSIQIAHAGSAAISETPKGPSKVEKIEKSIEMTAEDIVNSQKAFASAAIRAKEADYDIIVLHAAHGYLISEFLSPVFNKRTDKYGGSLENRMRMLIETVDQVRQAVPDKLIGVKFNVEDFAESGLSLDESTQVVCELYRHGVLFFEASGGIEQENTIRTKAIGRTPYHANGSLAWKKALAAEKEKMGEKAPQPVVACVGGIRSGVTASELIDNEQCDLISLARPLLAQPDFVNILAKDPKAISKCVSCGGCFIPIMKENDFRCNLIKPK